MKRLIIMLLCFLSSFLQKATAQPVCKIHYTYDAAGNRIQREFKCEQYDPGEPSDPTHPPSWLDPSGVISNIYPVPASGVVYIAFSAPISNAQLYLTNMSGIQVMSQTIGQQQIAITTMDMTSLIPGTYILTCIFGNNVESYVIPKL